MSGQESTQAGHIVVPKSICTAFVIGSLALWAVVGSFSSPSTGLASTSNLRKSSQVQRTTPERPSFPRRLLEEGTGSSPPLETVEANSEVDQLLEAAGGDATDGIVIGIDFDLGNAVEPVKANGGVDQLLQGAGGEAADDVVIDTDIDLGNSVEPVKANGGVDQLLLDAEGDAADDIVIDVDIDLGSAVGDWGPDDAAKIDWVEVVQADGEERAQWDKHFGDHAPKREDAEGDAADDTVDLGSAVGDWGPDAAAKIDWVEVVQADGEERAQWDKHFGDHAPKREDAEGDAADDTMIDVDIDLGSAVGDWGPDDAAKIDWVEVVQAVGEERAEWDKHFGDHAPQREAFQEQGEFMKFDLPSRMLDEYLRYDLSSRKLDVHLSHDLSSRMLDEHLSYDFYSRMLDEAVDLSYDFYSRMLDEAVDLSYDFYSRMLDESVGSYDLRR